MTHSTALIGSFSSPPPGIGDIVSRRLQVLDRLRLTDPADDREELQSQKTRRVQGTCEWIRDDPEYQQWLHGYSNRLWISGGPGMVKTMLSIFLTEELEVHTKDNNGVLIYYFCSHDDEKRNTEYSVLRGLLLQLVQSASNATFEQHVWPKFALAESAVYTLSTLSTMWRIFGDIVRSNDLEPIYCVLDGLDECNEDSSKQVVQRLHAVRN